MAKTSKKTESFDFEATLAKLNQIVEGMESGGFSLEESLRQFENGVMLIRQCQAALKNAEQKVQILIEQNGETKLAPFEPSDNQ